MTSASDQAFRVEQPKFDFKVQPYGKFTLVQGRFKKAFGFFYALLYQYRIFLAAMSSSRSDVVTQCVRVSLFLVWEPELNI